MSLNCWGFLYTAPGADPERDLTVADTGRCRTVLVGMDRPEQGADAAVALVERHHVQMIELCGGFGPLWTAKIIEAIGHRVPVGAVAYGPESIDGVHEIFS